MKKKLCALLAISMFLLTGVLAAPAASTNLPRLNQQFTIAEKIKQMNVETNEVTEEKITEILESTTLQEIIDILKEQIQTRIQNPAYKKIFTQSMTNGIEQLTKLGITDTMNLAEANDALTTGIFNKKQDRYLPFMFNILPTVATVFVMLEPMDYNLTEDNPSDVLYYHYQIFVKVIPFVDFVITEQLGFLKSLSQISLFFPLVGIRLMLGPFTVALLAFGPRVHWIKL